MNTDLKARAEALLAALKVDGFGYIAGRPLDDLPWLKEALTAFMEAADAATVLNLIRERDEAQRAGVEAVGLLSRVAEHIGDDAPLSREIYAFLGKPNSKGFVWAKVVKEGRDFDAELDRMRSTALAAVTTAEARAEAAEANVETLSRVVADTAAELGCEADNEAILSAIDGLKSALSAARGEVERLRDKVDGLSADLDAAVMVAFKYGAKDWARLNYPKHYATLTKEPTDV